MDINKREEQWILIQNTEKREKVLQRKKKRMLVKAAENIKKVVMAKLDGRMAEC